MTTAIMTNLILIVLTVVASVTAMMRKGKAG